MIICWGNISEVYKYTTIFPELFLERNFLWFLVGKKTYQENSLPLKEIICYPIANYFCELIHIEKRGKFENDGAAFLCSLSTHLKNSLEPGQNFIVSAGILGICPGY